MIDACQLTGSAGTFQLVVDAVLLLELHGVVVITIVFRRIPDYQETGARPEVDSGTVSSVDTRSLTSFDGN
jgi:hypothetical protein